MQAREDAPAAHAGAWRRSACGRLHGGGCDAENTSAEDIAAYVYENSGYGCGESKDGVSLTLLLRSTADGAYTLAENDWCVYAFLDEARGSAQELSDVVRDAVSPYMVERAWNGEDMTMSATALSQAVNAMAESVEDYIHANASPDVAGDRTREAVAGDQAPRRRATGAGRIADMNYIFDLSDMLSSDERDGAGGAGGGHFSRATAAAFTLPLWMTSRSTAAETDVYKTTYQLYHANELGMGEGRDGIIILLSMADRDYAMFVYGENAENAFNEYGAGAAGGVLPQRLRQRRMVQRRFALSGLPAMSI